VATDAHQQLEERPRRLAWLRASECFVLVKPGLYGEPRGDIGPLGWQKVGLLFKTNSIQCFVNPMVRYWRKRQWRSLFACDVRVLKSYYLDRLIPDYSLRMCI